MKRGTSHNLYHFLFVASTSIIQDSLALMVGLIMVLLSVYVFTNVSEDIYKATVGLPLLLAGISICIINFLGVVGNIFDTRYNFNRCPFCNKIL